MTNSCLLGDSLLNKEIYRGIFPTESIKRKKVKESLNKDIELRSKLV